MKLKNLIIGLIAFVAIAPVSANAASSISIDCAKNKIAPNETVSCTLKGKSDESITALAAHLTLGENLTLVSADVDKNVWMGDAENGAYDLAAEADPYPTGDFVIGTFKVKAGEIVSGFDSSISIVAPTFVDENFEDISIADVNKSIRIASTVNTLSKLTVDGKEMDLTKDLKATIDATSTEISATASDSKAKISGTGKVDLKYGENIIEVKVTSEAGTVKTYKLTITRPDNRNTDNTLANLTINGEAKDLTKELNYTIDSDTIEIAATPTDVKATVSGDIGKLELKYGENTFKVKVTAENETEKVYTIKVTRPGGQGIADDKLEGDGPQTGIADYALLIGGILVIIGAGTYMLLKKKGKFNRL